MFDFSSSLSIIENNAGRLTHRYENKVNCSACNTVDEPRTSDIGGWSFAGRANGPRDYLTTLQLETIMAAKAIASTQTLESMCLIFKLLSDATRLEIVLRLTEKEHTVTALCKELKLPQPTVSHHLGLLRMNHLIVNKRAGKQVIYSLASQAKISKKGMRLPVPPFTIAIEQD